MKELIEVPVKATVPSKKVPSFWEQALIDIVMTDPQRTAQMITQSETKIRQLEAEIEDMSDDNLNKEIKKRILQTTKDSLQNILDIEAASHFKNCRI